MTSLLLALALLGTPETKDCPPPKVVHPPGFKCKPGLTLTRCDGQLRCLPPSGCPLKPPVPVPVPPPVIVVPPPIPPPAPAPLPPPPPSAWHLGPFLYFGSGLVEPRHACTRSYSTPANGGLIEWGIGMHAHYLPSRLGGRLYYAGNYGVGGQAQLYLLQGEGLELHLDAGFLLYDGAIVGPSSTGRNYASVIDVERNWDFQYGFGVELPIYREKGQTLVLTLDARASQPLSRQGGNWTFEDGNTATNALSQFHLLGGVMFRM